MKFKLSFFVPKRLVFHSVGFVLLKDVQLQVLPLFLSDFWYFCMAAIFIRQTLFIAYL